LPLLALHDFESARFLCPYASLFGLLACALLFQLGAALGILSQLLQPLLGALYLDFTRANLGLHRANLVRQPGLPWLILELTLGYPQLLERLLQVLLQVHQVALELVIEQNVRNRHDGSHGRYRSNRRRRSCRRYWSNRSHWGHRR
jgi:hypothetical protein